jgi:hypothetical protein
MSGGNAFTGIFTSHIRHMSPVIKVRGAFIWVHLTFANDCADE